MREEVRQAVTRLILPSLKPTITKRGDQTADHRDRGWSVGQCFSSWLFYFDIELKVYMVRVSYEQKPYRRIMMETWGATCVPSPTPDTRAGRAVLEKDPDSPGSLGIAISEAVEDAVLTSTPIIHWEVS